MSCIKRDAISRNYLEFNFRFMQFLGMWNPYNQGIRYWLYQFYTIIGFSTVVILYTILEIVDAINVKDDLRLFTQNICLTMTHLAGIAKIINLWMRKAKIHTIVDTTELTLPRNDEGEMGRFYETTISRAISHGRILTKSFVGIICFTAFVGISHPFWDQSWDQSQFPYRFYCPMNTNHSTVYWSCFVFMASSVTVQALMILSHDVFFVVFMLHVVAQITILKRKVATLFDETSFINDRYEHENQNMNIVGTVSISVSRRSESHELTKKLRSCINHHQGIIWIVSELESVFGNVILFQFATSLIIIGLTGFQVSVSTQVGQFLPMMGYFCAIIFELSLYCWYGNEIIVQSQTTLTALYACSWYQGDLQFCKTLRIFMARAQKPLVVTAGNFCDLSLETFVVILSRSYSYMAILNQINE